MGWAGIQGRDLGAGADGKAERKLCLLLSHRARSACFLVQLRITCPGVAPSTVGWATPTSITNQENVHKLPTGQSDEDVLSVEVPSFQTTLGCVS